MTEPNRSVSRPARNLWAVPAALSAIVAILWAFPVFWYRAPDLAQGAWFAEAVSLPGWSYHEVPVAAVAERILTADELVNGEYRQDDGAAIRVFSAKRFEEKSNDIGLFVHTPDRCWTEAGWKIAPLEPGLAIVPVHGIQIPFERRVFVSGNGHQELVYFGGLVAGAPLPYRLDHNLNIGRQLRDQSADRTGSLLRATDPLYWKRLWDSFSSRSALLGPKQFIRISTPVQGDDFATSDALLKSFLEQWLRPQKYDDALQAWHAKPAKAPG
jgi:hypothetical protein